MNENGTEKLGIDHNTVRKHHDACATTPVTRAEGKTTKDRPPHNQETSHNSTGHCIQVSTRNKHP